MSTSVRVFVGRVLFLLICLFALVVTSPLPTGQALAAGQASRLAQRSVPHTTVPHSSQGTVLYQADWSKGMDGWAGSSDWKVDAHKAMLLNDGTVNCPSQAGPTIVAPYQVKIADYAVEATIQILRYTSYECPSFGLSVRGTAQPDGWKGYMAGADLYQGQLFVGTSYNNRVATAPFSADTSWHTYRVEVKDNEIKVLLDGSTVIDTLDNNYLSGEQVGLWCYATQIQVSSFVVSTL
jgi:hypothetical protein